MTAKSISEVKPSNKRGAHHFWDNTNGNYSPQFINGAIKVNKNGLWGLVDTCGNLLLPTLYEKIYNFSEGLALVKRDGEYGFIDTSWKEVIPCAYSFARDFSEGLAVVCRKSEGFGYVDYLGNEVIRCYYHSAHSFNEGVAITSYAYQEPDGGWAPTNSYIIDKSGRILYFGMDDISNDLHEGLIAQNIGYEAGYINKFGEKVIPFVYKHTRNFINGMGVVTTHDDLMGIIDTLGNQIVPPIYDYISPFDGNYAKVKLNNKYGIIHKSGKEIVPCKYSYIYEFNEGKACVRNESGRYGCINELGSEIIECKYTFHLEFHEGLSCVQIDNKFGFMNADEEIIVPCKYDDASDFTHGIAVVLSGGRFLSKEAKWGAIDKVGKVILPCEYESVFVDETEGFIIAQLGNKQGIIDKFGIVILPFIFDKVFSFNQQFAWVEIKGKYGLIKRV